MNTPQDRYDATHTTQLKLKLNTKTDADILARLSEVGNKQGYIKALIRADIEGGNTMTRYDYEMLRNAATSAKSTQDDINALGEWFNQFGETYWNGEYYDADGLRLFPIYTQTDDEEFTISGYEFR